ncbi:MAG: eukaryotic-like serine/threonine-protein kinase [Actinomycetota bacterium]|jgi:beta-lactam-binding protein with PASTA domain
MARPVPADLEDALAASPAARERFWSLPPEQVDAWVRYVERARFPGARRRRIGQAVRRLGVRPRAATRATTVETNGSAPPVAPPNDNWLVWLLAALVLAALIGLVLWLAVFRDNSKPGPTAVVVGARSSVPHVVGLRVQAAKFQLRRQKLGATVVLRNSPKSRGVVLGQAPRTGARVPQGTPVKLLVSNGPLGASVPKVVGLSAALAVERLRAAHLGASLNQVPSTQAPGTVLAQRPAAGTRAKAGTAVVLSVAKGKVSVTVPNVVGRKGADAVVVLRRAGLTARPVSVPSSQTRGTVVAENPPAGRKVAQGSTVRLNVSRGRAQGPGTTTTTPPPTTTTAPPTTTRAAAPPVRGPYGGMQLATAVQRIAQGRQQAIVVYAASSRPVGTVLSSSTAGSRVRLNVSAGPQPAPATSVPDVTGEDAATAVSDLRAAGFRVIQVKWPVTDQASDGVVVAQTPAGRAPQGAAIVVYVGSTG